MCTLAAIADTNFYLGSSDAVIDELRDLERQARVRPMASFLACSEILSHLTDTSSEEYPRCRAAIRRLFRHCYHVEGASPFRVIADPHELVANTLFNYRNPSGQELAAKFGRLVRRAATYDAHDRLVDIALDLQRIKRFHDENEVTFVRMLERAKRDFGLDANAPSEYLPSQRPTVGEYFASGTARLVAASGIVMNVAEQCDISLGDADVDRLARVLLSVVPGAVAILEEGFRKVLIERAEPSKLANNIWDMWFVVTATSHLTETGLPVALITSDAAIRRAAMGSSGTSRVFSPDEYRSHLLYVAGSFGAS